MDRLDKLVINIIQRNLPVEERFKDVDKRWINVLRSSEEYRLLKSWENLTSLGAFREACRCGNKDLINMFIRKGETRWHEGLFNAIKGNQMDWVIFFMKKLPDQKGWAKALNISCKKGLVNLVRIFINRPNTDLDWAARFAAEGGQIHILKLLENMGLQYQKKDRNGILVWAVKGGNFETIDYLIGKGIELHPLCIYYAAAKNNITLIDFLIKKGCCGWDTGMSGAAYGGHLSLVNFFIDKGASNWERGGINAAEGGQLDMLIFFIKKGFTCWNEAFEASFFHKKKINIDVSIYLARHITHPNMDRFFKAIKNTGKRDMIQKFKETYHLYIKLCEV